MTTLVGCDGSRVPYDIEAAAFTLEGKTAKEIYKQGKRYYDLKLYENAIIKYEALARLHPKSRYTVLAKSHLFVCYLGQGQGEYAIQAGEDFIELYPLHKDVMSSDDFEIFTELLAKARKVQSELNTYKIWLYTIEGILVSWLFLLTVGRV